MKLLKLTFVLSCFFSFISSVFADEYCKGFGPQTPRDITQKKGLNANLFSIAPKYKKLNLCNIHYHTGAEHKGKAFSQLKNNDPTQGYQCASKHKHKIAKVVPTGFKNACQGVTVGDTVEFHWVHTSCDVDPGPGLGACLSDQCANPQLRVETQVYLVTAGEGNSDRRFKKATTLVQKKGKHQAKKLPSRRGAKEFLGSTTGPKYSQTKCSPLQVTWSVPDNCKTLSLKALSRWCKSNVFNESKAHGVRPLVTHPALLSKF